MQLLQQAPRVLANSLLLSSGLKNLSYGKQSTNNSTITRQK